MTPTDLFLANAAAILVCMIALWLLSIRLSNTAIVDAFWAPGFSLVAGVSVIMANQVSPLGWLVAGMAVVWSVRLGALLMTRTLRHLDVEDSRYAKFRTKAAPGWPFYLYSLRMVFLLQGTVMWLVSLPIQLAVLAPVDTVIGPLAIFGAAIWAVGMGFEVISDWQMGRFKANPANAGKVLNAGLWRYSRHPNYFGEICVWIGIAVAALSAPAGLAALLAPAIMAYFLIRVTGVPMMEDRMSANYPAYAAYQQTTPVLLPGPPKSSEVNRTEPRSGTKTAP